MAKKGIQLGDEIEDVTSKLRGIVIGRCEYLSGVNYWIVQPSTTTDNVVLREQYIPEAYCLRISAGVRIKQKTRIGFNATTQGSG